MKTINKWQGIYYSKGHDIPFSMIDNIILPFLMFICFFLASISFGIMMQTEAIPEIIKFIYSI